MSSNPQAYLNTFFEFESSIILKIIFGLHCKVWLASCVYAFTSQNVQTKYMNKIVFQVVFPTGTSVRILLYDYGLWIINLEVYPTVLDVFRTSGLFGFLDGNIANDLRREDGTIDNIGVFSYYGNHPDAFSMSWQ